MKLLVLTQKVDLNDDVLGFMCGWIEKFSEKFELVNVVCLQKGNYSFSDNVNVFSLGKEEGRSKIKYIYRFYKYIFSLRHEYDVVFVHMNIEYIFLGGLFWRMMGKKIALWFAHKKGSFLRKAAVILTHRILSISKESFVGSNNKKFRAVGHGINTDVFKCASFDLKPDRLKKIISIGRLSPVKGYDVLLDAIHYLVYQLNEKGFIVELVGAAANAEDEKYIEHLKNSVSQLKIEKNVIFKGSLANNKILPVLCSADVFVSMQCIGGAGKSFLEAMSCGTPTVVCTPAFNQYLGEAQDLFFYNGTYKDLADKLQKCLNLSAENRIVYAKLLRKIVVEHHNLNNLIDKIKNEFDILCAR